MTIRRRAAAAIGFLGLAAVAAGALAPPTGAHVTADRAEIPAGGFATVRFTVPHGCEGSATTSLSVAIPPGAMSVKPQVKPGWTITVETEPLDPPVESHGRQITERVSAVTWTGGPLPDEFRDEFTIGLRAPETGEDGEIVYFPSVQTCQSGETAWIERWDGTGDEPAHPAPMVRLVAATGGHGGGGAEPAAGGGEPARATGDGEMAAGGGSGDSTDNVGRIMGAAGLLAGVAGLAVGSAALVESRRRRA